MATETISQDLADLLATKNFDPKYTDEKGRDAAPGEAVVFSFDWTAQSGKNYGTAVAVIGDENDLQFFFGDNLGRSIENPEDKEEWFQFLETLSNFATQHRYTWSPKDINQLKHTMAGIAAIKEGLFEGYYGTRRVSYMGEQTQARLVIKHNRMLGENDKRYRYVESLYIETADNERFKLPFTKLAGGRAMLEHVRQGGKPYDIRGAHIAEMVTEMNVLARFNRASQNKVFEGNTQALVESAQAYYQTLQENLKHLASGRGYTNYFESWSPTDINSESALVEDIKTLFVEQTLDARIESALPLLAKIQQGTAMKEVNVFETWINRMAEGTWALPDTPEQEARLEELMGQELVAGPDGTNATEQLYDLVGDDQLFDLIKAAAASDPNANIWDNAEIVGRLGELGVDVSAITQRGAEEEPEQEMDEGLGKNIKRGLQGWDKNAVGPGGEKLGDPREIVKRAKAHDVDTAKEIRAGLGNPPEHSPAGLQKRVLDRKLKGVAEGDTPDSVLRSHKYFYSGDKKHAASRNYSNDAGDSYDMHLGGKWEHRKSATNGQGLDSLKKHLQGVAEGKPDQLPTNGADYSKYDTDHLKTLLKPGILHRNESRFKALIRKELQKRQQQGVSEMDKSQPSHGRDGKISHSTYGSRDRGGSTGPERTGKMVSVDKMKAAAKKAWDYATEPVDAPDMDTYKKHRAQNIANIRKNKENPDLLDEVSDSTLMSYLTKVDADSQKHKMDPTKRSPEKANRSVAGFNRAFNKLDARREKMDEGHMGETDAIIQSIIAGDVDPYDIMAHPSTPEEQYVAKILEKEYEDVAIEHRLHPDDDFEQILDRVVDRLEQDYGRSMDEADSPYFTETTVAGSVAPVQGGLEEGGNVFAPGIENTPEYKQGFSTGKLPVPYPEGSQQYASYYKGVIDKASPTLSKQGMAEEENDMSARTPQDPMNYNAAVTGSYYENEDPLVRLKTLALSK